MGRDALTQEQKTQMALLLAMAALETAYYYRPRPKKSWGDKLWDLI